MTKEYQEATNEYLRGQNVNPIVSPFSTVLLRSMLNVLDL